MSLSFYRLRPQRRFNEVVDEPLTSAEHAGMTAATTGKSGELFDNFQLDHCSDHNAQDAWHVCTLERAT